MATGDGSLYNAGLVPNTSTRNRKTENSLG